MRGRKEGVKIGVMEADPIWGFVGGRENTEGEYSGIEHEVGQP